MIQLIEINCLLRKFTVNLATIPSKNAARNQLYFASTGANIENIQSLLGQVASILTSFHSTVQEDEISINSDCSDRKSSPVMDNSLSNDMDSSLGKLKP